jgi:outer membrane murein-binding lipoprotein Lpp
VEINIRFHGLHPEGGGSDAKLDQILARLTTLLEKVNAMSVEMDRLQASVAELTSVRASVITLLDGLSQQIRDLAAQPTLDAAKLTALANDVDSHKTSLTAAVVANTPTV